MNGITPSRARRAFAVLLLLLPLASCGYSLAGRGAFLPAYIQTIGIPQFTNNTAVFNVERTLTERVTSEFIGRGKYKVVQEREGVDALVLGEVSSIAIVPTAFNAQQQASRYALVVTAKIEFRDLRADKVLWSNPSMQFREEFEPTTGTDALDPAAFFGQDVNALERISQEFARAIVSAILEAF